MALTRITKGVIKPNENYDTHNINSTGIVTAIGLDINGNGDISGNLSVGGVLTYEDVTSIDSVGIITARDGIHVGAGISVVGVGSFGSLDISGDIDVDGHTNLDNVSVAGVSTFSDNVIIATQKELRLEPTGAFKLFRGGGGGGATNYIKSTFGTINVEAANSVIIKVNNNEDSVAAYANDRVDLYYNNQIKLTTASSGVNVSGTTTTTGLAVTGVSTFAGNIDANGDLDVDGHTNLDNVSIAGVSTFSSDLNVAENIIHTGDTDTKIRFTNDVIQLQGGGTNRIQTNNIGARIDTTLLLYGDAGNPGRLRLQEGGALSEIMVARNSDNSSFLYFKTEIGGTTASRVLIDESGHFRPNVDSTYDLGITGTRWRNVYADTLYGDGSNLTGIDADKIQEGNSYAEILDTGTNGIFRFLPEGSEVMRITHEGKMGLGTNNPQSILHIEHTTPGIRLSDSGNSSAYAFFDANAANAIIHADKGNTVSNSRVAFAVDNAEKLRIDSTGKTTSYGQIALSAGGSERFNVSHVSGGNVLIKNPTAANLTFETTSNTSQLQLHNSGNIGINESSPSQRLHVGGDVQIGFNTPNDAGRQLNFNVNRGSAGQTLANINWQWNSKFVAQIRGIAGSDTTNKDDAHLAFFTSSANNLTERLRITSNGKLIKGHTSNIAQIRTQYQAQTQLYGSSNSTGLKIGTFSNDAYAGNLEFVKSRSATIGTNTLVQNGDTLGSIYWGAADGSQYQPAAIISASMDGSTGTNDIPTRLTFLTAADGANGPTERLRIDSSGRVMIGSSSYIGGAALAVLGTGNTPNTYACFAMGRVGANVTNNTAIANIRLNGGTLGTGRGAEINAYADANWSDGSSHPTRLTFHTVASSSTSATERLRIDSSGHTLPGNDNTYDLGSSAKRWRFIFTTDLQLSNENTGGNEVDGTEGNWTLQEGADDIYMINRKNGKRYKIKMEEV